MDAYEMLKLLVTTRPFTSAFVLMLFVPLLARVTTRYRVYWLYFAIPAVIAAIAYEMENLPYFYVFVLGMITAFAEIINKFPDDPIKALGSNIALAYLLVNGAIGCFALMILETVYQTPTQVDKVKAVLIAGLGSMLIMRSKLFNIKIGGEDISFGPEQIVRLFFRFMESSIDRIRAEARAEFVRDNMADLDFERISDYTLTMLDAAQTWSEKERKDLEEAIARLQSRKDISSELKSYRLGFHLLKHLGEDFVISLYQPRRTEWRVRAPIEQQPTLVERITGKAEAPRRYFSYGTNLSTATFLAKLGLPNLDVQKFDKLTSPVKGILEHYRVVFDKPSREHLGTTELNLSQEDHARVEGIIYTLNKDSLDFLDNAEPGYSLQIVSVRDPNGQYLRCNAFFYEGEKSNHSPDRAYVEQIIRGAEERGLSEEYISELHNAADLRLRHTA